MLKRGTLSILLLAATASPPSIAFTDEATPATLEAAHTEVKRQLAKIRGSCFAWYESIRVDDKGTERPFMLPPSTKLTPEQPCCKQPNQRCDGRTGWDQKGWDDLIMKPDKSSLAEATDSCVWSKKSKLEEQKSKAPAKLTCTLAETCADYTGQPCNKDEAAAFEKKMNDTDLRFYQYQFTSKDAGKPTVSFLIRAVGDPLCDGHQEVWEVEFQGRALPPNQRFKQPDVRRIK